MACCAGVRAASIVSLMWTHRRAYIAASRRCEKIQRLLMRRSRSGTASFTTRGEPPCGGGSDVACHRERVGSCAHVVRMIEQQRPGADARDRTGVCSGRRVARRSGAPAGRRRGDCAPRHGGQGGRSDCRADDDGERTHRSDRVPEPLHARSTGAQFGFPAPGRGCEPRAGNRVAAVRSWSARRRPAFGFSGGSRRSSTVGLWTCRAVASERCSASCSSMPARSCRSTALIDSVWGEQAPPSARHMVHEYVSRLRGALGDASVIATRAPGYVVQRRCMRARRRTFRRASRRGALRGRRRPPR